MLRLDSAMLQLHLIHSCMQVTSKIWLEDAKYIFLSLSKVCSNMNIPSLRCFPPLLRRIPYATLLKELLLERLVTRTAKWRAVTCMSLVSCYSLRVWSDQCVTLFDGTPENHLPHENTHYHYFTSMPSWRRACCWHESPRHSSCNCT